jgi:transcriptional antiterminator
MGPSKARGEQLCELLTQKFKNKFNIQRMNELAVVQLVESEIRDFIKSGSVTESNLKKLELRLKDLIQQKRDEVKPISKVGEAISQVTSKQRPAESTVSHAAQKSGLEKPKKIVFHADPQAKLIPTDSEWNSKVQNDY